MAAENPSLEGMGTTFTVLLLEEGAFLGHVGDSRAYLLREGGLASLTRDHSLVAKMVREGFLTPRQARVHPRRNVILRALGMESRLVVDLSSPDLRAGDRVLLCTDGLTSHLEDEELEGILVRVRDTEECCRSLVAEANARGGEDNVTVVVIDLEEGDLPREPAGGRVGPDGRARMVRRWKRG
jgi:protein phosphatase